MKQNEIEEQQQLPAKYKPLTSWDYFWHTILYAIPLVGFVFLIIHAISDANINRRGFARSYFCVLIIIVIAIIIMAVLGVFSSAV